MTQRTHPFQLHRLALGLTAVAARLGPKEAATVCGEAAATLSQAMIKTTDQNALQSLAQDLTAVAGRMEAKEAATVCGQAAATLSQAMTKTTMYPSALQSLAESLSAVLLREYSWRNASPKYRSIGAIGTLTCPASPLFAPALFQPLSPPLPAQTLIDLLKQPFCVGEARQLVLEQLARHYQQPLADQWEFVRFAQEQKLDLDLLSPPQRPEPAALAR
jgi:hypothetical protein